MNKEELQKLIESKFEENCEYLEYQGFPVDYLDEDNFTKAVKEIIQEVENEKNDYIQELEILLGYQDMANERRTE